MERNTVKPFKEGGDTTQSKPGSDSHPPEVVKSSIAQSIVKGIQGQHRNDQQEKIFNSWQGSILEIIPKEPKKLVKSTVSIVE